MILYHASTAYHVLCCIVHKLAYHKEEKATFMIVEHMLPKDELNAFITKLDSFSWFDEIIPVPESSFRLSHGKTLNTQSSETDILEVIRNICMEVDKWYPASFHQYKDLYVASDQWSVGVYLLYHKIPYHYFEDASGMLGDEERYLTIIRELNLSNYVIGNYLKGAGRSEVVVEKLCDMKNQPAGFFDDKAVDFSIYHIVSALSTTLMEQLLLLYGAKRYKINSTEKVIVYMTQFLKTLTIKNLEVQEHITTLLLDYFAQDCTVIIKPHPKDRWIDYRKLLPEAIILDNSLPSELLPFVLEGDIHLVLTASSTSIGGMTHIAQNSISFGTDIEIHYDRLHDMYTTAKLVNEVYHGQEIITHNIKSSHLEHFLSLYSKDFSNHDIPKHVFPVKDCSTHDFPENVFPEKTFPAKDSNMPTIYIDGGQYIIGESNKKNYVMNQTDDILIFLNYSQRYEFLTYPGFLHNNFIVLENKLQKDNEIWVYCEIEEERRKILSINERRTLKYSGLEIELSSKEATYSMILNGKMKALQYALKQKENEEQNQVFCKIKEVIKQYQEEEITKHVLLEEEGIIYE